jgi:signal transduction histidine kinase
VSGASTIPEERVLVIAPLGQDSAAIADILQSHAIPVQACSEVPECLRHIQQGIGALVLTEEALELPQVSELFECLKGQPAWSEIPLIILTTGGACRVTSLLDLAASAAGSVTLLERPMSPMTLLRSVQVALRSRQRQYRVRTLLDQLRETQEVLERAQADLQRHADDLERIVAERTTELRETNEQLEAFVYSIAHDLRAPLRSLTGYSQLLLEDHSNRLDQSGQHLLNRIQASSEFMDKLLLDLLAYGRTARAEVEVGPVDVRRAWEMALFQCASHIDQTQAKVEVLGPLPTVIAHEATLGQCLANLLSNALKFVTPGVRPHVRFWAEQSGERVVLYLQDNGIGIPANQYERVFRVFERLHGAKYAGTGIGLSIVRRGVERMGGSVGLESEPGQGTRFWIELRKSGSV